MKGLLLPAIGTAFLALVACGEGEEILPGMATPSPTPAATVAPTPAGLAPPVALEAGASITEEGTYVMDVASGQLWQVAKFPGSPWSPDGKTLMMTGCCIGKGGIDLIDMERGTVVRILSGDIAAAAWSPDGSQIAFSHMAAGPKGLYLINRDGGGLQKLFDKGSWTIEWSPRGDRIATWLPRHDIAVQEIPQGNLHLLHVPSGQFAELPVAGPADFAWSPDGASIALGDESGLFIYNVNTGERRQVAAGPSRGPILWSPDGSRIAFPFGPRVPLAYGAYAGDPEAGLQLFHVVDIEGSEEPIPLPPGHSFSWSPDGSRLAYLSAGCITGEWDIYTMRPDGSSIMRLTNTPDSVKEGPAWSPVGSAIAFSTFDKLMVVDADSGELRTLALSSRLGARGPNIHLHGSAWSAQPWSPNGRYIVFGVGGDHGICD